jgi:3-hydroxyacyl-CoA dehydrogenase
VPESNPFVRMSFDDGIAIVTVDNPPVNALSQGVRKGLLRAMERLSTDRSVKAVVITGTSSRFIAGADLREMDLPPDEPFLPDVVAAIEAVPQPVAAMIDGPALGGGLEIALACDLRIATPKASAGLPETRVGLIPGSGGTQRLPRLVGIAKAIDLICEGRILKAKEALQLRIFDEIADGDLLALTLSRLKTAYKRRISALALPEEPAQEEEAAAKRAMKKAKDMPAIGEAVRVIRSAREKPFEEALCEEREAFLKLRQSEEARALRYMFTAEREAAKVPGLEQLKPRPFSKVGVIGAGTMGSGIAMALSDSGLSVSMVERDAAGAESGRQRIATSYNRQVKSGRLDTTAAESRLARITVTDNWSVLEEADLAIDAAFEDFDVKKDIFERLDASMRPGAVLATNTSYLDVDAIAAVTKRPQDVVGLHFFSPANVMKLLEIVRGAQTSPETLAAALALARRLGKQPVVAGNCDGFIGNRIYAVYRRHAEYLVEDGAMPWDVDNALEAWGFAMGVFAVSDLSGLDIGYAMRKRRAATRHPSERYVAIADRLYEEGLLGRKSGSGWYAYDAEGNRKPDPEVETIIAAERMVKRITARRISDDQISRRLLAVMANEGAKVLEEGIAIRASDIDTVFVNGYGFPRSKGGPMWTASRQGLRNVLAEVEAAYAIGGAGSEPSALLVQLARQGRTFGDWRP